jgi:Phage portal protein
MTDTAARIAYNDAAPADERQDAQSVLQKANMPRSSSDLIPADSLLPLVQYVQEQYENEMMQKALSKPNIIPFPSLAARQGDPGMQSVWLDDQRVTMMGDWYERPSAFSFDAMRTMVDSTPILGAVMLTRIRQVNRFCRLQDGSGGPGFEISMKGKDQHASKDETESMRLLGEFFLNSGWESKPRQRMRLKRDNFSSFMSKLTRDTLTLDSAPIETEWKRDSKLGLDGLYAVDGATIRLCSEQGYEGEDEIFALQVVEGQIRSAYSYDDLIYVPRNPRTDVTIGGYGMSETELLIRVVTGFLNAFTYNTKYFDSNAIPKGLLHLSGEYSNEDLASFRRMWNAMVKGVNNAWTLPVMVSKNQESKASFENFGTEVNEIMFAKWMTFLTSIICAVYGIAPDEINFESFSAGNSSSLSGNDTGEKLANSKDKGLRPLLSYFENLFSEFIVSEFSDKYCFRWTGLDPEEEDQRFKYETTILTVNELRAKRGEKEIKESWGDAPLNPSLIAAWQAEQQQNSQDFGQPGQEQPGQPAPGTPGAGDQKDGKDFGTGSPQNDTGADFGTPGDGGDANSSDGDDQDAAAGGGDGPGDQTAMQKSFGLPIYTVE